MSKIALIASSLVPVDNWRRQTGISMDLAPWIASTDEVAELGPFSSVLCLTGWRDVPNNENVYEYIVAQITAARLSENAAGEGRLVAQINEGEWLIPENPTPTVVERVRPAATFPSTPPMSENERVLQDAEEEISRAAGFLDAGGGPAAVPVPDSMGEYQEPPRPQPRAYSDPLRDHLRSYMHQERRTPRRRPRDAD